MDPILEVARKKGIYLIEDCAEAHGAEYRGRKVGCFGDISCFSFYGNKILTTGEGGMCLTDSSEYADLMKMLRDHGMNPKKRYWHDFIGFNYRMTNLQAALGVAQLERIESTIRKKLELARLYKDFLGQVNDVALAPEMPWAKTVYWIYSVLIQRFDRDKVMLRMDEDGVETRPFFYPAHRLPPYRTRDQLIEAERLSRQGINLPSSTKLSKREVLYVCESLKRSLV
jgi:perosamine synthetase